VKCVLIDAPLERLAPAAFEFVLGFAYDNRLRVKRGREQLPTAELASLLATEGAAGNG
jgi:hypothetical protein